MLYSLYLPGAKPSTVSDACKFRSQEIIEAYKVKAASAKVPGRFSESLIYCNIALSELSKGAEKVDEAISDWILKGRGNHTSALGNLASEVKSAFVNDFKLAHPVVLFGKPCKDTADLIAAAGTIGLVLGLLNISLLFVSEGDLAAVTAPKDIAYPTRVGLNTYSAPRNYISWVPSPNAAVADDGRGKEDNVAKAVPFDDFSLCDLISRSLGRILSTVATSNGATIPSRPEHNQMGGTLPAPVPLIAADDFVNLSDSSECVKRFVLKASAKTHYSVVRQDEFARYLFSAGWRPTELAVVDEDGKSTKRQFFVISEFYNMPRTSTYDGSWILAVSHFALCKLNLAIDNSAMMVECAYDPTVVSCYDIVHRQFAYSLVTRDSEYPDTFLFRMPDGLVVATQSNCARHAQFVKQAATFGAKNSYEYSYYGASSDGKQFKPVRSVNISVADGAGGSKFNPFEQLLPGSNVPMLNGFGFTKIQVGVKNDIL